MTKKLHLTFVLALFSSFTSIYCQLGDFDFDDQFEFAGANPTIKSISQNSSNCGVQSLTLSWFRVQGDYHHVDSYSLQVKDNGNWKTLKNFPNGVLSHSYTVNSFENTWIDSDANFNFRVRVNINIEDAGTYWYSQGSTLKVRDWCFGSSPNLNLISATIKNDGQTYNVLNGERAILSLSPNPDNSKRTYFNFLLKNNGGTAYGIRKPKIDVYFSDKSVLGSGLIKVYKAFNTQLNYISSGATAGVNFNRIFSTILSTENGQWRLGGSTTYYIHFLIKDAGQIPSLGAGVNHYVFPFKVDFISADKIGVTCTICPDPGPTPIGGGDFGFQSKARMPNESYNLEIYDLTGKNILTKKVSSKNEENTIIGELPKKIYILKTKNGIRKVY